MPDLRSVDLIDPNGTMPVALRRIVEEIKAEAEARVDANPAARTRYNRVYHRHNR